MHSRLVSITVICTTLLGLLIVPCKEKKKKRKLIVLSRLLLWQQQQVGNVGTHLFVSRLLRRFLSYKVSIRTPRKRTFKKEIKHSLETAVAHGNNKGGKSIVIDKRFRQSLAAAAALLISMSARELCCCCCYCCFAMFTPLLTGGG